MREAEILNRATVVLIQLRQQRNYTQRFVADVLDMHLSPYCRLESGKQKVTLVNLFRLSGLYNMSVTDLVAMIETPVNVLKKVV